MSTHFGISRLKKQDKGLLVDGFNIAGILKRTDPHAFELLATYAQSFHRIHPGKLDQRARPT
ncbi:MAG: hypothetical protein WBM41_00885 [Arenicellales bacterium]